MLTAEVYSDKCKIPKRFRLYHGGKDIGGLLRAQTNTISCRVSDHIYFSLSMGYVQEMYLHDWYQGDPSLWEDEEDLLEAMLRKLYVLDARCLFSNSFVMTNIEGVWYYEICCLEDFLEGFEKNNVDNVNALQEADPEYRDEHYDRYFMRQNQAVTKHAILQRLTEARTEWFYKYCKPFNLLHLERYRNQERNIILVPGPILVSNP